MLKKLLAFLLVASMMMFTLGACSSSDSGSSTTTAADAEGDTTVGETTEEATEAPTEAPTTEETTEDVTEAQKTYSYTEVFKLDFTTMADGTAPFNPTNVDDIRIEGGLLKGTGTSGDPYFNYTGELALDASTVQEIHIKLKNYSSSYDTRFFFTTETIGWRGSFLRISSIVRRRRRRQRLERDHLLYRRMLRVDRNCNQLPYRPERRRRRFRDRIDHLLHCYRRRISDNKTDGILPPKRKDFLYIMRKQ